MKAKKIAVLCAAVGMLSLLFTGCGESMQSEEEIVIPKGESTQEEENQEGQDLQEGNGAAEEGGIAQMVQAPERYTWEGNSGNIHITVDAPVMIPQAEGFKTYKVTSRVFTQEDYDKVNQVLLNGGELWARDYEAMEGSNGYTASEIDEIIERLQSRREAKEVDEKYYDERIEEFKNMREDAPEEAILVGVEANVSYQKRESDEEEYTGENSLYGNVTIDGEDYAVLLDNDLRDDWRWISFSIQSPRGEGNYYPTGRNMEAGGEKIVVANVREEAERLMADMGFSDFAVSGEEYFCSTSFKEEDETLTSKCGYGVHFTRCLDGIPVTYTDSEGTTVEKDDVCSWPYEVIDIVFDEEGFTEFRWTDPYELEKLSDEDVFLLPFSDIQNIFEEMLFKKAEDFWKDMQVEETFHVNEVRLGYMRVMEKGNVMEGTMIPVWDFFGSETFYYGDMEEAYTEEGPYKCLLTINAMDGTIIDRGLGY